MIEVSKATLLTGAGPENDRLTTQKANLLVDAGPENDRITIQKAILYIITSEEAPYGGEVLFEVAFVGRGIFSPTLTIEGATDVFFEVAFYGRGVLAANFTREPPFDCEAPEVTNWTRATPVTSGFNCATTTVTAWTCAGDEPAPAPPYDLLVDVAGNYLVYVNGDRIKLI